MVGPPHRRAQAFSEQLKYLIHLSRNPVSLLGIIITTVSAVLMLVLFVMEVLDLLSNPYVGIITFLVLPVFFISGLILIPIGFWRVRRLQRKLQLAGVTPPELRFPRWDFNDVRVRKTALFVIVATIVNVVIISSATYEGIHHMESVAFCGTTCHAVMKPEFTVYQNSPHARVACTGCHVGPGAAGFVEAKLSGVRQVFGVAFNNYSRPIPTPVHNLRPARETCERCHWPEKFAEPKVKVIRKYKDDEKNTPLFTALLLKVEGVHDKPTNGSGIHWWHLDPVNRVTYISDEKRETMFWVEHRDALGQTTEFRWADSPLSAAELSKKEKRVMDCIDCHNRPTHIYQLPEQAVDLAIGRSQIDPSLPFVRKKGVELLKGGYGSAVEAYQKIEAGLKEFYQREYPEVWKTASPKIAAAIRALQDAYSRNVYPEMNITWGTYADNIGHENFPGCFRCHDDNHKSQSGSTIPQDCSTCHDLLAQEEEKPQLIPELLQVKAESTK
jgi:hypothetical protein